MFSNALVGLVFAIGAAGWVYAKTQKSTGNNTKSSLIVAAAVGAIAFLVVWTLMGLIPE